MDDIQQNLILFPTTKSVLVDGGNATTASAVAIKSTGSAYEEENMVQKSEFQSVVPGFPVLTEDSISDYRIYWGATVLFFLLFGGLFAPMAGSEAFGRRWRYGQRFIVCPFPQLAEVDPIVASFTGGTCWCHFGFFRD